MALQITSIKDFPSKQAEAIQKHLLELDNQGKLLDYFKKQYPNLGAENSLTNYILKNWEKDGKKLFIEWTGIETFSDKHTIKRTGVKLNEVSYGSSNRYFLWKCGTCKYEWVTVLNHRTCQRRHGCPKCGRGKQAESAHLKGEPLDKWCNTQGEYGEQLKEEFIGLDENNKPIKISIVYKSSRQKVWWKCSNPDCKYEWTAQIVNRTNAKSGCPACNGAGKLISGVNDLETYCHQHPELNYILEEFVGLDENNQHILPSEVARGSYKKVYWECNNCHKRWLTHVVTRTGTLKTGCPHCNTCGTSFPEQFIYGSLKQLFPDTLNRAKDPIKNYEFDIAIPSLRLCIEYSGYNWHKDKIDRDKLKERHCKSHNVDFLQIYEHTGNIKDTDGNIAQDTYTPSQIVYKVSTDKSKRIKQLQYIIKFILEQYSESALYDKINFTISEQQANKIMNKA